MKTYIHGYYSPSDVELNILGKESNRKILEALRDAYPCGRNAHELAEITGLPIKTTYAQLNELSRGGFITELPKTSKARRGRPQTHYSTAEEEAEQNSIQRQRSRFVIEDTKGIYSIYDDDEAGKMNQKKRSIPLPPGNVVYSNEFIEVWHKIVEKEEEDELCTALLNFLDKTLRRINESSKDDDKIRRIAPSSSSHSSAKSKQIDENYCCCSLCGLNHEARDFIRAMLLYLFDQLEENSKFIKLLKNNQFLTQEAYQRLAEKIEARNHVLVEEEEIKKKGCNHIIDVIGNNDRHISPRTAGCEECEIEKTQWVGLRLCLTCGHVGCCDSSIGLHATKHFVNTGHPVMVALPNKPWKWCYIHKVYG